MYSQKSQNSMLKQLLLVSVVVLLTACGGVSIDSNSGRETENTEETDNTADSADNSEQTQSDGESSGTVTLTFVDWNTELPVTALSVKRMSDGVVQVTDKNGKAVFTKTEVDTELQVSSPEVKYGQRQIKYDPDISQYRVIPVGQLKMGEGSNKVSSTVTDRSTSKPVENVVAYLFLEGHDPSSPFKQAN